MKMVLNKLKPYMLAVSMGLAGILGAGTAKAAEPLTPSRIEQILKETKPPENPAELLTPKPKKQVPAYKDPLEWLIVGSEIGASVFAATAIHEMGHAITGTALGYPVYDIKLYPHKLGDRWVAGSYSIRHVDSKAERVAIAAGGMIATRLTAEVLDGFMNYAENHPKGNLHPRTKQALAALYFMNRFESTKNIINSAIPCWLGKPQTGDVPLIVHHISNHKPRAKRRHEQGKTAQTEPEMEEKAIYAGATVLLILDTIADWDEIKDNWNRLWMIDKKKEKKRDYNFGLDFLDEGVQANFTYTF